MQSWKRVAGELLSVGYGLKNALVGPANGLRILIYHSVAADSIADRSDIYSISRSRFTDHLDYLSERRADVSLTVRPFSEISEIGVSITFDDGYSDNLDIAAPLLIERGFPFHVFVNPGFLISGDRRYLNQSTLCELAGIPGVTIGAHGYSHKRLTECSPTELNGELNSSKKWLEDTIGQEITSMAYPHGALSNNVKSAVEKAGFELAACSRFGLVGANSNRFALERTDIWSSDNIRIFGSKLEGNWDWMRIRT